MGNCFQRKNNYESLEKAYLDLLNYYINLIVQPNTRYGTNRLKSLIEDYYSEIYGKPHRDWLDEKYHEEFLKSCKDVDCGHKQVKDLFDFIHE